MQEPTVLDYLKALLDPRRPRLSIPPEQVDAPPPVPESKLAEPEARPAPEPPPPAQQEPAPRGALALPEAASSLRGLWLPLLALTFALVGQSMLEPPSRDWQAGVTFYLLGAALLVGAYFRGGWTVAALPRVHVRPDPLTVRNGLLLAALLVSALAFYLFRGNRFTALNVLCWALALGCWLGGLWLPESKLQAWGARLRAWLANPRLEIRLTPWTLLVVAAVGLVVFFRFYRLDSVPPEMISDHAEKLWDVRDVLDGQYNIFFPRNTGREPFQFYLTAAMALIFGTGISFMSLKLGTTLAGLVTLVYLYLLGAEFANRRVGLLAAVLAGIGYWPNVISRIALRFALYPLFTAPTLYYLVRGIRRQSRNDFILAGLFLGLGLHGYSSFRAVPVLVVVAAGLYALHHFSALRKPWFWLGFASVVVVSTVVFLPLLRYITETPEQRAAFSYRLMTRISDLEQPLPGPPAQVFLGNLWRGVTMFGWDNGGTWPHSVVFRPALDAVSGGLFHLGVVLLLVRYARQRNWLDLFWLVSIPVLLLPSVLSLAFPAENPSLNRPAGAYVPVFLIAALALDGLMSGIENRLHRRQASALAWAAAIVLIAWSAAQNYDLVFRQYFRSYQLASWNTTELGAAMRGFVESGLGEPEGVWIVGYPHWVDTRLASLIAGYPHFDPGVMPDQVLARSQNYAGPKLFMLHPNASDSLQMLQAAYPGGLLTLYDSKVESKDFWIYFVPGNTPIP